MAKHRAKVVKGTSSPMRILMSSMHRHICTARSSWRRIWWTTCATSAASRSQLGLRWTAADERPAKITCCIVTETTLSLLSLQHLLCCMLCGRQKVRRTRTLFRRVPGTYVQHKQTVMVPSSNSVLTVPARPNIARKPGHRKHACAEWASQQ